MSTPENCGSCTAPDCPRCKIAAAFERIKAAVRAELVAELCAAADFLDAHAMAGPRPKPSDSDTNTATADADAVTADPDPVRFAEIMRRFTETLRALNATSSTTCHLLACADRAFDLLGVQYDLYGAATDAMRAAALLYRSPIFAHVRADYYHNRNPDTGPAQPAAAAPAASERSRERTTSLGHCAADFLLSLAEYAHYALAHRAHAMMDRIHARRKLLADLLGAWHDRPRHAVHVAMMTASVSIYDTHIITDNAAAADCRAACTEISSCLLSM